MQLSDHMFLGARLSQADVLIHIVSYGAEIVDLAINLLLAILQVHFGKAHLGRAPLLLESQKFDVGNLKLLLIRLSGHFSLPIN